MGKGGSQVKLQIVQRLNNSSKVGFCYLINVNLFGAQIILCMIMMFFLPVSDTASSEES